MKNLILLVPFLVLAACAGVQSVSVPAVQEISYKDIIECKKVDEVYSDCKIKDPKSGIAVVIRLQTAQIPAE